MSKPNETDNKFSHIIFGLEEAIFELEEILNGSNFSEKEKEDLITAKELAISSRDISMCVIASKNGKKQPPNF